MADKVATMVIKVDLDCDRCYQKIKKVLCKFPEIRNQIYDEKQKKVTVTVITCCPERILEKIKRKGGESVEGIEIVPEKKKEGEKKTESDKSKEPEKKKDSGEKEKPKDSGKKKDSGDKEKPKEEGKKKDSADIKKMEVETVSGFPTIYPSGAMIYPAGPGGYYQPSYYGGGYGGVPAPAPYYHGPGRQCMCFDCRVSANRYDYCSGENPYACSIM